MAPLSKRSTLKNDLRFIERIPFSLVLGVPMFRGFTLGNIGQTRETDVQAIDIRCSLGIVCLDSFWSI
jgi:hypothetical protein